jgi:hypothetical protein
VAVGALVQEPGHEVGPFQVSDPAHSARACVARAWAGTRARPPGNREELGGPALLTPECGILRWLVVSEGGVAVSIWTDLGFSESPRERRPLIWHRSPKPSSDVFFMRWPGAVQEMERVSAERDELIREARTAGASVPDIARASGVGTRRVRQILPSLTGNYVPRLRRTSSSNRSRSMSSASRSASRSAIPGFRRVSSPISRARSSDVALR